MRKSNQAFAERVQALLDKHGLSLRGQRPRTGISHVTVQSMLQGVVPQMETVVAWAQGFGEDVNEWLVLAGFDPIRASLTPRQRVGEGLLDLKQKYQLDRLAVKRLGGLDSVRTMEEAERLLREIEEDILAEQAEDG